MKCPCGYRQRDGGMANAVLRSFLTGIGVNIILGQLGDFTGYSSVYENKIVKAIDTFPHLGQINYQVLLVGVRHRRVDRGARSAAVP